ncbi:hypothetical protein NPX13_g7082 [Xylaria arbuscula]|uniref:Uncharacterized protein n=1 Tax=Xylaria arbuscula TaxID=114810 RepID=A0A9W8TJT0_9PEZI|nr:hypothetical protein NPX13_g7082 [Xylaria arbuscula]
MVETDDASVRGVDGGVLVVHEGGHRRREGIPAGIEESLCRRHPSWWWMGWMRLKGGDERVDDGCSLDTTTARLAGHSTHSTAQQQQQSSHGHNEEMLQRMVKVDVAMPMDERLELEWSLGGGPTVQAG